MKIINLSNKVPNISLQKYNDSLNSISYPITKLQLDDLLLRNGYTSIIDAGKTSPISPPAPPAPAAPAAAAPAPAPAAAGLKRDMTGHRNPTNPLLRNPMSIISGAPRSAPTPGPLGSSAATPPGPGPGPPPSSTYSAFTTPSPPSASRRGLASAGPSSSTPADEGYIINYLSTNGVVPPDIPAKIYHDIKNDKARPIKKDQLDAILVKLGYTESVNAKGARTPISRASMGAVSGAPLPPSSAPAPKGSQLSKEDKKIIISGVRSLQKLTDLNNLSILDDFIANIKNQIYNPTSPNLIPEIKQQILQKFRNPVIANEITDIIDKLQQIGIKSATSGSDVVDGILEELNSLGFLTDDELGLISEKVVTARDPQEVIRIAMAEVAGIAIRDEIISTPEDLKPLLMRGLDSYKTNTDMQNLMESIQQQYTLSKNLTLNEIKSQPIDNTQVTAVENFDKDLDSKTDALEEIKKAILEISDKDDDNLDALFEKIKEIYRKKFEIEALIGETNEFLKQKGGLKSVEDAKRIATQEKMQEFNEDKQLKLRALNLQYQKINNKLEGINRRLVSGILTKAETTKLTEEAAAQSTELEKIVKSHEEIQVDLSKSRTGRWFDFIEDKTKNYVEFAETLREARKARIEAEEKHKTATAKYTAGVAIQKSMEKCLKDMKGVSTQKCDRINALREIYREAKRIEGEKNKLVQDAALMINPSRGLAKYTDSMDDGSRIRKFDELLSSIDTQYANILLTFQTVMQANGDENNFRKIFPRYYRLLKQAETSSAFYGDNQESPDNIDLKKLRDNNSEVDLRLNETADPSPAAAPPTKGKILIADLYTIYFLESTSLAKKVLERQKLLLQLSSGGGDIVRQNIDARKRRADDDSSELNEKYQELKSLPTEIEKTEETVKACFGEGLSKSKKEKEDAFKKELGEIKAAKEKELQKIEEDYKANLSKLKAEVKQGSTGTKGNKKPLEEMTPEELAAEKIRLNELKKQYQNNLDNKKDAKAGAKEQWKRDIEKFKERLDLIGRLQSAKPAGGFRHRTIRRIR